MPSTFFALFAEFNTGTVDLSEVCEKYFGLTANEARRRARRQELPVPVYRGSSSQKSPYLINISDLSDYLDLMRERAIKDKDNFSG